jgi:hypothetical protein
LQAVVRDRASRRNAYYLPTQGKLRFGDFDAGPSALSADVLYTSSGTLSATTHRSWDEASRLTVTGSSGGYSDYFAHAALGNPVDASG